MFSVLARGLLAALCVAMVAEAKAAVVGPLELHPLAVDERSYPWSAIGKLFNEAGGECSGVVIARDKILTAAHCLFSKRTGRYTAARSMHFLMGYRAGHYSVEARIAGYEIGAGFDPLRYQQTTDADWAILTLAENLPVEIKPLRLSSKPETPGTKAVLAGYPQDRAYAMTADRACELRGSIDAGKLLLHTCRGVKGTSGAPILVGGADGMVRVAGIQIATLTGDGTTRMLAVPAQTIWRTMKESISEPPILLASITCGTDVRGPPGVSLSDIQVRLDPDRLDLSATFADVLETPAAEIAVQFAMIPVAVAAQ
jgi:protease YdgD